MTEMRMHPSRSRAAPQIHLVRVTGAEEQACHLCKAGRRQPLLIAICARPGSLFSWLSHGLHAHYEPQGLPSSAFTIVC